MRKAPLGQRQVPKPSLGSKISRKLKPIPQATPDAPEETIEEIEEEKRYFNYITAQYDGHFKGQWVPVPWETRIEGYASRREAYETLRKHMMEKGNPRGWTLEGDLEGGRSVVYDGVFIMMNAPSYKYHIAENIPWVEGSTKHSEELPDPITYWPKHNYYSADATRQRMDRDEWDPENPPKGPGE